MHNVHLSALDLNQLPVLAALLELRNVTRAAERLGLSQSATSHALARLRRTFDDPLLVRGPGGLVLTERAEALQAPLGSALAALSRAIAAPEPFRPAQAERRFSIGSADYVEILLLPGLLARIEKQAPGIQLWFKGFGDEVYANLVDGTLDLALAPPRPELDRPGIRTRKLFDDDFVSLVRRGHPSLKRRWTAASFAKLPHAFVAPRGRPGGAVDQALAQLGLERIVRLATAHFLVAPFVLAHSELVLTVPRGVANALAGALDLVTVEPPVALPTISISMFWHERVHHDPAHLWLREAVLAGVAKPASRKPTY